MAKVITDLAFGVRTLDTKLMVRVDAMPSEAPLMFNGVPVIVNDLCVKSMLNIKRWRRLNRPDKVRIRSYDQPSAFIINPPMVSRTSILCHSKIVERLSIEQENKNAGTGHIRKDV